MFDLTWYNSLNHPYLTPAPWVFPPVWTVLYFTLFTSVVIYAAKPYYGNKSWGFTLFFAGLAMNLCWTPAFFFFKNPGFSLVIISILDILVLFNIIEFYKVSKSASRTLIPYFIWILFATYLNAGIFILN